MKAVLVRLSVFCTLVCVCLPAVVAGDWPHLRGPNLDGRVASGGALAGTGVGLELAWKAPLGTGYSGIVVADGRVVTLYSDGESDWVVAFDAASGGRAWRHRLDETNKPVDGSDGGPLASPVIADGTVYALGPRGQLLALGLADGKPRWARTLPADFESERPHFGFATSPLVEDAVLVVQTGGAAGRAISGIDRETGEALWSLGDDKVEYQSPAAMSLGGRRQVVTLAGKRVRGVDPRTGTLLWTHELGEGDYVDSANPTWAGGNRVLFFASGAAVAIEVSAGQDGGFQSKELYRSKELGNTYALPVLHGDHLYGFRGQILVCVSARTGEAVWKSRPPGGRGLILVDDRLVVFGAAGHVVVAEATPEGYREVAKLQALEASGYTWPAFADGRVFVRNLEEIAAVSIVNAAAPATAEIRPDPAAATEFGRFVRRVEAAEDKQARIAAFLERNEHAPLIEGRAAHFFYVGEVEDIAVSGTMVPGGNPEPMQRIAGTDFYHRSFELEPAGRWEYQYTINFGERIADPRNPRDVPAASGQQRLSVVTTEGYETPAFLDEPAADRSRGTLETVTFESESLGDEREVKVYLPAGYAAAERAYPLLIVHQGPDWIEKGRMVHGLDNLIGNGVAPVVVAFVAPRDAWWVEAGGSGTAGYVAMLADELVPFLASRYRLADDAASRAVMGTGYFGSTAALAALTRPDVFGGAALQSVALGLGAEDAVMQAIRDGRGRGELRLYLDWNRYELRSPDQAIDLGQENRMLARALDAAGYAYAGGEVLDSYGWGGWPARTDRILETLFPEE